MNAVITSKYPKFNRLCEMLKIKIDKWYDFVLSDYGITGNINYVDYDESTDDIIVSVSECENGEEQEIVNIISYASDYSLEQIYNIWQEYMTWEDCL